MGVDVEVSVMVDVTGGGIVIVMVGDVVAVLVEF
jgi:hypothetical protein